MLRPSSTPNTTTWMDLERLVKDYISKDRKYDDADSSSHFSKSKDAQFWSNFATVADLDKDYSKVVEASNKSIHTIKEEVKHLAFALKESDPEFLDSIIQTNKQQFYQTSNKLEKDSTSTSAQVQQSKTGLFRVPGFSVFVSIPNKLNETTNSSLDQTNSNETLVNVVKNNRCVFIPSRYRAQSVTFEINENSLTYSAEASLRIFNENCLTIRIFIVDCDEFEDYRSIHGDLHIIISKPPNFFGVGASRFWCQMIAESLHLKCCWMVDDSTSEIVNTKIDKAASTMDAFLAIENVVQYCSTNQYYIGLCGIEKLLGEFKGAIDIRQRYVGNFVFLNIEKLKEKKVYYRCELVDRKEDILFAYDCFKSGLNVCKVRVFCCIDNCPSRRNNLFLTGNNVESTPNFENNLDKDEYKDFLTEELAVSISTCEKSSCCDKYLTEFEEEVSNIYLLAGKVFFRRGFFLKSHNALTRSITLRKTFTNVYWRLKANLAFLHQKEYVTTDWNDLLEWKDKNDLQNKTIEELRKKGQSYFMK